MEKIDARKIIIDAKRQRRYQIIRLRKQGPLKRSVPMPMLIVSLGAFEKTSNDAEARYEILQKA